MVLGTSSLAWLQESQNTVKNFLDSLKKTKKYYTGSQRLKKHFTLWALFTLFTKGV